MDDQGFETPQGQETFLLTKHPSKLCACSASYSAGTGVSF